MNIRYYASYGDCKSLVNKWLLLWFDNCRGGYERGVNDIVFKYKAQGPFNKAIQDNCIAAHELPTTPQSSDSESEDDEIWWKYVYCGLGNPRQRHECIACFGKYY